VHPKRILALLYYPKHKKELLGDIKLLDQDILAQVGKERE
jgi:hypothetical protein